MTAVNIENSVAVFTKVVDYDPIKIYAKFGAYLKEFAEKVLQRMLTVFKSLNGLKIGEDKIF